jgi:hypothetical protein
MTDRRTRRVKENEMTELIAKLPTATVSNPILLWLFKQGWEDPTWGQLPVNQVALGLVLHDLANKLADRSLQEQIHEIAEKIVINNARSVVK